MRHEAQIGSSNGNVINAETTNYLEIDRAAWRIAPQIHDEWMENFTGIIYDNERAATGALVGLIATSPSDVHPDNRKVGTIVAAGPVGDAKSLMMGTIQRLIGVKEEDVALIPQSLSLVPERLTGFTYDNTEYLTERGTENTKVIDRSADAKGIVRPGKKIIFADELTRINPAAMNVLLEAADKGSLITDAGRVSLEGFQIFMSTLNPAEIGQATVKLSRAMASRHIVGIVMEEMSRGSKKRLIGGDPDLSKVKQIVDPNDLDLLRKAADTKKLPDGVRDRIVDLEENARRLLLERYNYKEGAGRFDRKLAKATIILSMLDGEMPTPRYADEALKYVLPSRCFGADNFERRNQTLVEAIQDFTDEVLAV